ncbi:unnamed protein product, partial [Prorocentrum cordatum]
MVNSVGLREEASEVDVASDGPHFSLALCTEHVMSKAESDLKVMCDDAVGAVVESDQQTSSVAETLVPAEREPTESDVEPDMVPPSEPAFSNVVLAGSGPRVVCGSARHADWMAEILLPAAWEAKKSDVDSGMAQRFAPANTEAVKKVRCKAKAVASRAADGGDLLPAPECVED